MSLIRRVALTFACALVASAPALAQSNGVADFYKDRRINLIVGYGTGGGFDVYARLVARHIGRFIPGGPSVTVQNMPGAGSLVAVNHLYNLAPKDGATIAHFGRNIALVGALKNNPSAKFDSSKMTWLGSSSSFLDDAYILVVRDDSPIKTIRDAIDTDKLVLGGSAEGSTSNDVPVILRDTIGLRYKMVAGYPDSAALFLAVDRNEVHGRMVDLSGVRTIKPDWLKPGSGIRTIVQFGRETRHPMLADVPTARELAKTPEARALIELTELPYKLSRPFAAPPGIPPARAEALQTAFAAAHKDPQFLEESVKLGVDISPVSAQGVLDAIALIDKAPPDALEYLKKLFAADRT
ncbi:MAG: hypothetical protein JWN07_190 [Hyphomicrobiales bacterium]|nr:hypothetical protein [Hyphomicrobiales bacterium]